MSEPILKIDGLNMDEVQSASGRLHLALNQPNMLQVSMHPNIDGKSKGNLENQLKIGSKVALERGDNKIFSGYIVSLEMAKSGDGGDTHNDVTITCFDSIIHKALAKTSSKVFGESGEVDALSILEDVFGDVTYVGGAEEVLKKMRFGGDGEMPQWFRGNLSDLDILRQFCDDGGLHFGVRNGALFIDDFRNIDDDREVYELGTDWLNFSASASLKGLVTDVQVVSGTTGSKVEPHDADIASLKQTKSDRVFAHQFVKDALGETMVTVVDRQGVSADHATEIARGEFFRRSQEFVSAHVELSNLGNGEKGPLTYAPGDVLNAQADQDDNLSSRFDGAYFVTGLRLNIKNIHDPRQIKISSAGADLARPFLMDVK